MLLKTFFQFLGVLALLGAVEALIPILLLKKLLPIPIPLPIPLPIPIPKPFGVSFGKALPKRFNIKLHADLPPNPFGGVKIGGYADQPTGGPSFKVNFEPPSHDVGVQYHHQPKQDTWSPPPPPPPTEDYGGWAPKTEQGPTKQYRVDIGGAPAYQPTPNYKQFQITAHGIPFFGSGSLRVNFQGR